MNTRTKLLAEKHLYDAASRFFDEEDTTKRLSEKIVQATLPDGRKIEVDDEDYESLEDVSPKVAYGEDDKPVDGDVAQGPMRIAKYTGAARKNTARTAAAARYTARVEAGKEIYNQLADEIHEVVEDFAKEQIAKGRIAYDDDTEEWVIANDDVRATRMLLTMLQTKVNNEVIKPAKANLTKSEQDALVAAFSVDFTNPYFIKDQPAFKGTKRILKKTLNGLKLNTETVKEMFLAACDKILAEKYAKRYNVKLSEAKKMFVLNDKLFG